MIGGAICMRSELLPSDFLETIRWNTMVKWGAPLAPFNAWMLLRGLQTLPLRVERQCATARALAEHLEAHEKVGRVWYPGLASHPQHAIAIEQMPPGGAMLAFDVGSEADALTVVDTLQLASFAASLGGVRTVTQIPATMAFLDVPEARADGDRSGHGACSAGLEDVGDLFVDFEPP